MKFSDVEIRFWIKKILTPEPILNIKMGAAAPIKSLRLVFAMILIQLYFGVYNWKISYTPGIFKTCITNSKLLSLC